MTAPATAARRCSSSTPRAVTSPGGTRGCRLRRRPRRPSRRPRRRRHLQGPRHGDHPERQRPALRGRLPRRHHPGLRRHVPAARSGRRLHRPELPEGYAPFNVAAIGGNASTSPTPSRTPAQRTRSPARARGSSTCTTRTATFVRRVAQPRRAERAVGHGDAADGLRRPRRGPARRQLRRRAASTRTTRRPATPRAPCASATATPIQIDGLWALMFGNGTTAARRRCCSPPGPTTRTHGLFGAITTTP